MLLVLLFTHFAAAAKSIAQLPLLDCFPFDSNEERSASSLATFIASEGPIALQAVLDNIGSGGAMAPGVEAGLVVASPSKANPDCMCLSSIYLQPQHLSTYLGVSSRPLYEFPYPQRQNSSLNVISGPLQPMACCCCANLFYMGYLSQPYSVDVRQ